MDFPIDLTLCRHIYGREELKQNVILLLQNQIGWFLQSNLLGAKFEIHSSDLEELEEGVRATLEEIEYIDVEEVNVNNSNVDIVINYNGEVINFQYPIANG